MYRALTGLKPEPPVSVAETSRDAKSLRVFNTNCIDCSVVQTRVCGGIWSRALPHLRKVWLVIDLPLIDVLFELLHRSSRKSTKCLQRAAANWRTPAVVQRITISENGKEARCNCIDVLKRRCVLSKTVDVLLSLDMRPEYVGANRQPRCGLENPNIPVIDLLEMYAESEEWQSCRRTRTCNEPVRA